MQTEIDVDILQNLHDDLHKTHWTLQLVRLKNAPRDTWMKPQASQSPFPPVGNLSSHANSLFPWCRP